MLPLRAAPARRLRTGAAACALFAAALLAGGDAAAERVRCPVCGEEFDSEDRQYCPNDGTDLALEGRPVESPAGRADAGVADDETGAEPAPSLGSSPRYRRHDVGGERRRAEEAPGEYTERERRIGEERRGAAAASAQRRQREREIERARFAAEDERLREEFEQRRSAMSEDRRRAGEEPWWAGWGHPRGDRPPLSERTAPLFALGARLSWLGEDGHGGPLAGAEIDVNPLRTRLRVGLSGFFGVRRLPRHGEFVFIEHVSVGVQLPWRWSPYLLGRMGAGVLSGEAGRRLVLATGAEAGIDCHVTKSIVITPVVGYARYMIDDASWDSVTLRLGIGF